MSYGRNGVVCALTALRPAGESLMRVSSVGMDRSAFHASGHDDKLPRDVARERLGGEDDDLRGNVVRAGDLAKRHRARDGLHPVGIHEAACHRRLGPARRDGVHASTRCDPHDLVLQRRSRPPVIADGGHASRRARLANTPAVEPTRRRPWPVARPRARTTRDEEARREFARGVSSALGGAPDRDVLAGPHAPRRRVVRPSAVQSRRTAARRPAQSALDARAPPRGSSDTAPGASRLGGSGRARARGANARAR